MKRPCILLLIGAITVSAYAEQTMNPIITAMPSLTITPDARATGMAGTGVATSADLNAQYHNPAKYVYMSSRGGYSFSPTIRTRKLVSGMFIFNHSGYFQITDKQAISASFNFMSLGQVRVTDLNGTFLQDVTPIEYAVDLSYSRKIIDVLSFAITTRFMGANPNARNNFQAGTSIELHPGYSFAGDLSAYYNQPFQTGVGNSHLMAGLHIRNLGKKISFDGGNTSFFIPSSLNIGVGYEFDFCKLHHITISTQLSKWLVPTRKNRFAVDENGNPLTGQALSDWYYTIRAPRGWFMSFADAPGGLKEEIQELFWGFGVEYSNSLFAARFGYSHENQWKGNRRLLTCGIGVNLPIVSLDLAYVNSTAATNPLDGSFVITAGINLGSIGKIVDHKSNIFWYSPIYGIPQDL